jgi:ERCC4-type nuclease
MFPFTADDREVQHHEPLVKSLKQRLGNVVIKRMRFGDYAWGGLLGTETVSVGLEFCTVSDLAQKIATKKLIVQLSGLIQTYDVRILLIEGMVRPNESGRLHLYGTSSSPAFHSVREILFSAACHGVIIEHSASRPDTLASLLSMYSYWQKADQPTFRPSYTRQVATIPLNEPLHPAVEYLMGLPPGIGVGEERAKAVIGVVESVERLHTMTEKELRKIPGWGVVTARRFREFVTRRIE